MPQDDAEAVKWFRLAADQGRADAQFNLGMWLNLAASRASGATAKWSAEERDTVAGKMTPQQIAEAQRLAREWKPKTWDEPQKAGP